MDDAPREAVKPTMREGSAQLDLAVLWSEILQAKWLIIGITAAFAVASVVYAFTATAWYRAEVLLVPASAKSTDALPGQLGSLVGLAGLAGISVGGAGTSEPLAVLRSRDFAREFIEQENLLPVLFARKWDAKSAHWRPADPRDWPDVRDGVKYFVETIRTVQDDKKSGLITLTVDWTDAKLAADWANLLVDRANDRLRARALTEAQGNVDFLRNELADTDVVTLQQSIGRLLDTELQKVMLARGKKEFAFRVVDRAEVPKWRRWPKRIQIVAVVTLFGGMLSVFVLLFRNAVRRRRAGVRRPELSRT